MRAVSLWQPWASFIARGLKTIETRDWTWLPTDLVGTRLAIHAAKRWDTWWNDCEQFFGFGRHDLPSGAVVAHALVEKVERLHGGADQRKAAMCDCAGRVGIFLADVVRLDPPVAYRGHQGLFCVPDHLLGVEG